MLSFFSCSAAGEGDNGGGDVLARLFSDICNLFPTQLNLFLPICRRRMLNFSATVLMPPLRFLPALRRFISFIAPYPDKPYVISYASCKLMV